MLQTTNNGSMQGQKLHFNKAKIYFNYTLQIHIYNLIFIKREKSLFILKCLLNKSNG